MDTNPQGIAGIGPADLARLQFEYGWRWFEFHAKQRVSMFNYFLIITGILANAFVVSYTDGHSTIAVGIAALGILASIGFICFDIRNRSMASEGENVLEKLEADVIFGGRLTDEKGQSLGPLLVERRIGMREGEKRPLRKSLLKHKVWIMTVQIAVAVCYALAIVMVVAESTN